MAMRQHRVAQARAEPAHDGDGQQDVGNAIRMSVRRITIDSIQPSSSPPTTPSTTPTSIDAAAVATPAQQRHARAPHQARQQIATELVGAERMAGRSRWAQTVGRVHRVRIDERQHRRQHRGEHRAPPARARRATARPCRHTPRSLIADPRIEPGVEEIDAQIDDREGQRDHQHAALHERESREPGCPAPSGCPPPARQTPSR